MTASRHHASPCIILMSERWRGSVCHRAQPPRVKTNECKDRRLFLRDFNRATTPSTHLSIISIFPHNSPSLSSILPPLTCVSKPFRFSLNHALKTHADGNVILLTCARSLHLLLHLFLLCGSLELPVSGQQSWLNFCFFLTIHTQHLGLDWDLDSSRRLRYPGCSLSQFLFLSHPKASWPGWGHWSAHFKQLEILNPLSPRQSQLIWISCDYDNGSYKTPDSSNLPSPCPNSSHLPRGAGRPAVLFHGGWHSTLSLWRFQHSPRQALCYRLPFTPSFIWSQTPYHY